jgi:hypothetical protein
LTALLLLLLLLLLLQSAAAPVAAAAASTAPVAVAAGAAAGGGGAAAPAPAAHEVPTLTSPWLTIARDIGTSVWVYRNSVKALPVRFGFDFTILGARSGARVAACLTHFLLLRIGCSGSRLSE